MDPFTIMLAAVAAGGELFKGFANSASAQLQGKIAAGNKRLLEKQAEIQAMGADVARAKGTFEQSRLSDRVARVLASQTSHFAAAGLDPAASSPIVLAMNSAAQGEADAEIIRAGSALEAAHALTQSANTRGQATGAAYQQVALKQKETTDIIAGIFGAATSFLKVGASGATGFGGDGSAGYYGGSPDSNPLLRKI